MTYARESADLARRNWHYFAFGLSIESALELPELAPLECAPAARADVTIRLKPVAPPDGSGWPRRVGDRAYFSAEKTARFCIHGDREIDVELCEGGTERNLRVYLLGSALGLLFHRRGLLPLHANAIVVGGEAVAFAGRTGMGKSTLAAYFLSRGYPVLCDDVCVVSFDECGRPLAWPGLPRLKLWRDAAEKFGHDSEHLERAVDGLEKFHVPFSGCAAEGPYPLTRLYILDNSVQDDAEIHALGGRAALQAVISNTYRRAFLARLGLTETHFMMAAGFVRKAKVYSAPRRRGFDIFAREAGRLERHMVESRSGAAAQATVTAG